MPISGTVRELMTPLADFPHVYADQPLRDVFALLSNRYEIERFRTVLVFDRAERPVGRLTLHRLLQAVLPDYLTGAPAHYEGGGGDPESLALLWQEDSEESCRKAATQKVGEHMLPIAPALSPDAPLTLALYRLAKADYNLIPVAEGGRTIGVVRIVDLLGEVAAAVLGEGGAA
ncbi:MAG: CBS domain-containing protein [Rhodocyclaceae bacterium]|nr:CBS domain-containing protein [Rhodocyclaceae bacterium]